jgi:hypothetical protein
MTSRASGESPSLAMISLLSAMNSARFWGFLFGRKQSASSFSILAVWIFTKSITALFYSSLA